MTEQRHVAASPSGGWDVRPSGDGAVSSQHDTEHGAIVAARHELRQAGGGNLVIHGLDDRTWYAEAVRPVPIRHLD